jgi:hypothetical protein
MVINCTYLRIWKKGVVVSKISSRLDVSAYFSEGNENTTQTSVRIADARMKF